MACETICTFFYVFLRFFQNPKKHDFLRFFELLHTFSRTMVELKKTQSKKSRTVNKEDCSKPKRSRKLPATAKAKTCDDSVFYCIYCRELFTKPPTETWVQCSRCMQWCHESCAPIESLVIKISCVIIVTTRLTRCLTLVLGENGF